MKNNWIYLLPLVALLAIMGKCKDDDDNVTLPPVLKAYFDKNYPGYEAEELDEEKLCTGTDVYDVEIETKDEKELSFTFDKEGNLLFAETEIKTADLPQAVKEAVAAKYPGATVKEADRCDMTGGGVRFEVEIKDGTNTKEVWVEENGTIICDAIENDDDDDE